MEMREAHSLSVSDRFLLCYGEFSCLYQHSKYLTDVFNRINQVCDKGKGSVPRGRVYANYVSRCATERVTVLNPASFGKLVRVLFPGLKTRRLGVRGESKYHYVNFSLQDDQPELTDSQNQVPSFTDNSNFGPSFRYVNSVSSFVKPY